MFQKLLPVKITLSEKYGPVICSFKTTHHFVAPELVTTGLCSSGRPVPQNLTCRLLTTLFTRRIHQSHKTSFGKYLEYQSGVLNDFQQITAVLLYLLHPRLKDFAAWTWTEIDNFAKYGVLLIEKLPRMQSYKYWEQNHSKRALQLDRLCLDHSHVDHLHHGERGF